MAIAHVQTKVTTQKPAGSGALTITFDAAPTNGNVLAVWVSRNGTFTGTTTGTGWTRRTIAVGANGDEGAWFTKVAGASESATQTVLSNAGTSVDHAMVGVEKSGADTTTPVDVENARADADATKDTPSVTPTASVERLVLCGAVSDRSNLTTSGHAVSGTNAGAVTDRGTTGAGLTNSGVMAAAWEAPVSSTSGAYSGAVTFSTADDGGAAILVLKPAPSGTTFTQSLAGGLTPSGVLVQRPRIIRAGSATPAGTLARQPQKRLAGGATPSGTVVRRTSRSLTGSVTPSGAGSNLKIVLKALSGGVTPSGAVVRQPQKRLAGSATPTGSLVEQARKRLTGAVAPAGTLANVFIGGAVSIVRQAMQHYRRLRT